MEIKISRCHTFLTVSETSDVIARYNNEKCQNEPCQEHNLPDTHL